jgi:hypothetical protein
LTHPAWDAVRKRNANLESESNKASHVFETDPSLTVLPALLSDIRSARLQSQMETLEPTALTPLIHRASSFREDVLRAGATLDAKSNDPSVLFEIPSSEIDSTGSPLTSYQYCSTVMAGNYCHYWGSHILANRLLCVLYALQTSPPIYPEILADLELFPCFSVPLILEQESRYLAERICASLPYFRTHAPFGTLCVIFACELALIVSDAERKAWVVKELREQLGRTAGRMDLDQLELAGEILTGGGFEMMRGRLQ